MQLHASMHLYDRMCSRTNAVLNAPSVRVIDSIGSIVMASALAIADPVSFRVGPEKHKYTYERIASGMYKCSRGSDWAPHLCLFLFQHDDYWYAADAPSDTSPENIAGQSVPIFRSCEAVLQAGWHTWESNMQAHHVSNRVSWEATGLSCMTTILIS